MNGVDAVEAVTEVPLRQPGTWSEDGPHRNRPPRNQTDQLTFIHAPMSAL